MLKSSTTSNLKKHIASAHPAPWAAVLVSSRDGGYSRAKSTLENIKQKTKKTREASSNVIRRVPASSVDLLHTRFMYTLHYIVKGVPFAALYDEFLEVQFEDYAV